MKVVFRNFTGSLLTNLEMTKEQTLFDLCQELKKKELGIDVFNGTYRLLYDKRVVGVDFPLRMTLTELIPESETDMIEIVVSWIMGPVPPFHSITHALNWYAEDPKKNWPPWESGKKCPLNKGPLGTWEGWGFGPTRIAQGLDNTLPNLLLLEISDKEGKTSLQIVNYYAYLVAVAEGKDLFGFHKEHGVKRLTHWQEIRALKADKTFGFFRHSIHL